MIRKHFTHSILYFQFDFILNLKLKMEGPGSAIILKSSGWIWSASYLSDTDADAVFGLLYAQCEDDFNRVELNYIEKLGRLAEVNGEKDLDNDLYTRIIIDPEEVKRLPEVTGLVKSLMNAFADGVNYYLYSSWSKSQN